MNPLSVLHIRTWLNAEGDNSLKNTNFQKSLNFFKVVCFYIPDDVTQADPQIVADHPVHANFFVRTGVIRQHNTHSLAPLLSFHQHCVSTEELQLIHFGL